MSPDTELEELEKPSAVAVARISPLAAAEPAEAASARP
jgi:hypothetical protein